MSMSCKCANMSHVSCHVPACRAGGARHALLLLGRGPGAGLARILGLPAVADVALHAFGSSHRVHKHARHCLQEGGSGLD